MNTSKAYNNRRHIILTIVVIISAIYLFRIAWLQLIDDSYKASAANNSRRDVTIFPSRGLIFDRNGKFLVTNEAVYDLMVIPRQTRLEDTLAFCELVGIDLERFRNRIQAARSYSTFRQSIFETQIPKLEASYIQEQLYKYPGFYLRPRSIRNYPHPVAAHVLGHLGEVNRTEMDHDSYYSLGDYIGKNGLERRYEKVLRGEKGVRKLLVDVHNQEKGSYMGGRFDTSAVSGKNLTTTLDLQLQIYGQRLMENKTGGIVAIEPSTGEILALISAPSYDPGLLVGRVRSANYMRLLKDTARPMFNRALMASYPPGSIFKVIQALVAMDFGVLSPDDYIPCNQSWVRCHGHARANNVARSIQYSCNPYYYEVFRRIILQGKTPSVFTDSRIGLKQWHNAMSRFGLGRKLGVDLQSAKAGYLPTLSFYDHWYGKNRWAFSTIYSLSIGQGEVEITPLQMANLAAIIANGGYFIDPHLVKAIAGQPLEHPSLEPQYTNISKEYFSVAAEGMRMAVEEDGGTARRARIPDITVCGKTGTVQNPHGENHSVFMAFAPKENPQIAIAVYVENAGYGGAWAAPIASLMIEKYLNDTIQRPFTEERILNANFKEHAPVF